MGRFFLRGTLILVVFCLPAFPQSAFPHFSDVARQAGLTVPHNSSAEKRYIAESMSGGAGLFDCDNDGKLDAVLINGSTVDRFRRGGDSLVTLYHQDANLKFTDITAQAGLTRKGWGMGVAVGDFDNDGKLDLFVTGYNSAALYRNLGNCRFEDVTEASGINIDGFATGAAWGDYDRDGKIDLFIARYVHFDMNRLPEPGSNEKTCRYKGILVQCGPFGMEGESDFLFHNLGNGKFKDVSKIAGVDDPAKHYGLGAVWGDYDNDGWPDLYVANDAGPNYLYHNNKNGTFEETAMLSGTALGADGQELGSMGVDFGDFDHDGLLDVTVTNFSEQPDNVYRNQGTQGFVDMGWSSKMGQPVYPLVKWGTGFVDFDNDGWPDVFVASGHVYPQVDTIANSSKFRQPALLFRNRTDRTFEDISAASGIARLPLACRRGVAFGDVNNDGNMDMLILNMGEPPSLLIEDVPSSNHRVMFRLIGTKSNRAAIGARVTIHSGGMMQFNEVRGGGSYLSQNDLRIHFGLGTSPAIDTVEVAWPDGATEKLTKLAADAIYTITEGQGITNTIQLAAPAGEAPKPAAAAKSPH